MKIAGQRSHRHDAGRRKTAVAENVLRTGDAVGADIPKERHMHIWRLKALRLSSHHWEASTYRGDVIVRAESEANARRLATQAFWMVTEKIHGKEVAANPWYRPWLVAAEVLEGSQFDPDGQEEILYRPLPPGHEDG